MIRKLFTAAVLLVSTASVTAYSSPSYLKVYNYTDSELRVYVDGYDQGTIPVGSAPNWIPAPYGMHKVEVSRLTGYSSTAKWAELSYSYPNADVTIARYDL
ncbi:MAG: hypothetical protein U0931_40825 [Vulcanimicrobiota bacterium]